MTTTIALAGKGGVGKTTTAGMIIKYLMQSQPGAILAIDADPSSNLNMVLGLDLEWTVGDIRENMLAQVKSSLTAGGAAMGALAGHYSDYGIDKDFMDSVSAQVTEGTSALFLLTDKVVIDKVSDAVKKSGLKFEIISTNLSDEQEAQLKEDFGA